MPKSRKSNKPAGKKPAGCKKQETKPKKAGKKPAKGITSPRRSTIKKVNSNSKKNVKATKKSSTTKKTKKNNKTTSKSKKKLRKEGSFSARIGGTLKTEDRYLPYQEEYVEELKDKRWVAIIDKNSNEELAIVRLTDEKQKNTTLLEGYVKGNKKDTYFKHFVEVEDNEGQPIKIDGVKFIKNEEKYNLTKKQVAKVRTKNLAHVKQSQTNQENLSKLKGEEKKSPQN